MVDRGISTKHDWKTYGFVSDYRKTKQHNSALYLASMRSWYYFDSPKNLAFHGIWPEIELPSNLRSLMGLGLKFVPSPWFTHNDSIKNLKHFKRELYLKTYHSGADVNYDYKSRMYLPSTWMPQWWRITNEILDESKNLRQQLSLCFKRNLEDKIYFNTNLVHYSGYEARKIYL